MVQPKASLTKLSQPALALARRASRATLNFFKVNWKGTLVILAATLIFFWPLVIHIGSYSEGGDAMFNAWTLARNHHCILRQGCPSYSDGNIYFPHKDTMLYSETQLSAGVVTLPLHFINQNPLFAYNVFTIFSFFLIGWFMYLLGKYLSHGHELMAILAGLVFELAPFRMAAIWHLQNLSIFYLPLAVLLTLRYTDTLRRRYLYGLFIVLVLQFYASWYQMVFVLTALGLLLGGLWLGRAVKWRQLLLVGAVIAAAALSTYPLAKAFVNFSKANHATFSIKDQTLYSSSVVDYFLPQSGTLLGKLYYHTGQRVVKNAYNLDSDSYHGVTLYILAAVVIWLAYRYRKRAAFKRDYALIVGLVGMALVGLILSFGPLLKIKGNYAYGGAAGYKPVLPMPYLIIDKLVPQLEFIRAVGRWSVLFLFTLCCLLALLPLYVEQLKRLRRYRKPLYGFISLLIVFELMPVHFVPTTKNAYAYNLSVPKVYQYIGAHKEVDDIVIISADEDYAHAPIPVARAEQVLWAGYHNKNIFNGYSGYTPPEYFNQLYDFMKFDASDVPKMQALGLRYVLVDKQLGSHDPQLIDKVREVLHQKVYEDNRYSLFKL